MLASNGRRWLVVDVGLHNCKVQTFIGVHKIMLLSQPCHVEMLHAITNNVDRSWDIEGA